MTPPTDARIPVRFADAAGQAGPHEALLIEDGAGRAAPSSAQPVIRFHASGGPAALGHAPGCVCCIGRGAAATALGELFQARARGQVAWFTGVVAIVTDPAAIATELQSDRLAAARFRVLR